MLRSTNYLLFTQNLTLINDACFPVLLRSSSEWTRQRILLIFVCTWAYSLVLNRVFLVTGSRLI